MWWFGHCRASTAEGRLSTLRVGDFHARRPVLHTVRGDRPPVVNRITTFERLFWLVPPRAAKHAPGTGTRGIAGPGGRSSQSIRRGNHDESVFVMARAGQWSFGRDRLHCANPKRA